MLCDSDLFNETRIIPLAIQSLSFSLISSLAKCSQGRAPLFSSLLQNHKQISHPNSFSKLVDNIMLAYSTISCFGCYDVLLE